MEDTSPKVAKKMQEMLAAKTPEERFKMGLSMCEFTRIVVVSAIREKHPNISVSELRCELFLRYYGEDFDNKTKEKILEYLKGSEARK